MFKLVWSIPEDRPYNPLLTIWAIGAFAYIDIPAIYCDMVAEEYTSIRPHIFHTPIGNVIESIAFGVPLVNVGARYVPNFWPPR